MKKICYIAFHQGWTDIMCQLPLISYYLEKYDQLKVFFREDARELAEFYIKDYPQIIPIYCKTKGGSQLFEYLSYKIEDEADILFHGQYEIFRKDNLKGRPFEHYYWIESFYSRYEINYNVRIDYFKVNRDLNKEEELYQNFVKENGSQYVIYHDDPNNKLCIDSPTQIKFNSKLENHKYINLNKKSNVFFDYIKVIQNSKEIHLIDSIWGCMCYQLDAKYSLFQDKQVYFYHRRGEEFLAPKKLKNWKIIKYE